MFRVKQIVQGHGTDSAGVEPDSIPAGFLMGFLFVLVAFLVVVGFATKAALLDMAQEQQDRSNNAVVSKALVDQRAKENQTLGEYAQLKDGQYQLPIEAAKQLLLKKGTVELAK